MTMNRLKSTIALLTLLISQHAGATSLKQGPLLLQGVTAHQDKVVFATAGKLWQVPRSGGQATALTKGSAHDSFPLFSPNGEQLTFLRYAKGNADVYTLAVENNATTRLTNHPAHDFPVSWSSDSKTVHFASRRHNRFAARLYRFSTGHVMPEAMPSNLGVELSYSRDGKAAYVPLSHNPKISEFRYYRGGQQSQIHLINAPGKNQWQSDKVISHNKANTYSPKWLDNTLYYLSDKDGIANIYRHNGDDAVQLTTFKRFGVRDFHVDDKGFVFLQDGFVHTMDLDAKRQNKLLIQVPTSDKLKKTRRINAAPDRSELSLSPDGSRYVMVARGDVYLADGKTGKSENLTKSADAAERHAVMSPDGLYMAYFSDKSGKNQLHVQSLQNKSKVEAFAIEQKPGFYLNLTWSPDGKKLHFNDHRLQLWVFDKQKAQFNIIAKSDFSGQNIFYSSWSPDSALLAYGLIDGHGLSRIYVYDTRTQSSKALTAKDSYANFPQFDKNSRYLYYFASPNANSTGYRWAVLNGMRQAPFRRGNLKAIILNQGDQPPVMAGLNLPNLKVDFNQLKSQVTIDYDNISKRTITLDIGNRNVAALNLAQPGKLQIISETWQTPVRLDARPKYQLHQLDLRNPAKLKTLLKDIQGLSFSKDGNWATYTLNNKTYLKDLTDIKSLPKSLPAIALFKTLEPQIEWQQMFNEAFNFMVEQMYDPNLHGADPQRLRDDFARYLPNINSRDQLRDLLRQMIGFLSVSHSGSSSGDNGPGQLGREQIGLLGADFSIDNNRYRFDKIYRTTQSENPPFAPLDQYGARVNEGEYLIALNNQQVRADKNLYRYFFGLTERTVQLTVADNPQGNNPRKIQIQTIADEEALRLANWAQDNKTYVENQSQGKLKYVHIAGFNQKGIEDFLARFYQLGSAQGLVIDIRFNPGGITSDALINLLKRKTLYKYRFRQGVDLSTPVNAFDGQTTLIINQFNGSAAETFSQMFKAANIGTIVGKPTFGAGIGPYAFGLNLVDGARVAIPNRGSYMPNGKWTIENRGVHPHVDVTANYFSNSPIDDPQLNMAIEQNLKQQHNHKKQQWAQPQFPVHPGTNKAL